MLRFISKARLTILFVMHKGEWSKLKTIIRSLFCMSQILLIAVTSYCTLVVCNIGIFLIMIIAHYILRYDTYRDIHLISLSLCIYTDDTCTTGILEVQYSMVHDATHALLYQ